MYEENDKAQVCCHISRMVRSLQFSSQLFGWVQLVGQWVHSVSLETEMRHSNWGEQVNNDVKLHWINNTSYLCCAGRWRQGLDGDVVGIHFVSITKELSTDQQTIHFAGVFIYIGCFYSSYTETMISIFAMFNSFIQDQDPSLWMLMC